MLRCTVSKTKKKQFSHVQKVRCTVDMLQRLLMPDRSFDRILEVKTLQEPSVRTHKGFGIKNASCWISHLPVCLPVSLHGRCKTRQQQM